MNRRLISSGSSFEREIGYSRAVVDGEWVFVSGTTGFDYQSMRISENLLEQAEQCLRNITSALEQAGTGLRDVVRVTYILPGRGLPSMLADPQEILRRCATRRDDDLGGIGRPPDTNRNRGDGTPAGRPLSREVARRGLGWYKSGP